MTMIRIKYLPNKQRVVDLLIENQHLFEKMDVDGDDRIEFEEFQKWIRNQEYRADLPVLQAVYSSIDVDNDKGVTANELRKWRDNQIMKKRKESEDDGGGISHVAESTSFYVYFNESEHLDVHRYEFYPLRNDNVGYRFIAKLKLSGPEDDVKWAIFRPGLSKNDGKFKFQKHPSKVTPDGYWIVLTEDEEQNKKNTKSKWIKKDMMDIQSLRMIYELLHHYYVQKLDPDANDKKENEEFDHDHPLEQLICDKKNVGNDWYSRDEFDVRFLINGAEYRLTWWNERGTHDANALSIVKKQRQKLKDEVKKDDENKPVPGGLPGGLPAGSPQAGDEKDEDEKELFCFYFY